MILVFLLCFVHYINANIHANFHEQTLALELKTMANEQFFLSLLLQKKMK